MDQILADNNRYLTKEQIEMISDGASPETVKAVDSSTEPFSDERITCTICYVPYHTPNEDDGSIERPYMTACGHVFGRNCLLRWRTDCPTAPHGILKCPTCRLVLKFSACPHSIAPLPAYQPATPKCLKADEIPDYCLRCEYSNAVWIYRDPDGSDNTGTLIGKLEDQKGPIEQEIGKLILAPRFKRLFVRASSNPHDRDVSHADRDILVRLNVSLDVANRLAELRDKISEIDDQIADLEVELEEKMREKGKELMYAYKNQSSWKIPFFRYIPFTEGVPFLGPVHISEPEDDEGENDNNSGGDNAVDDEMEVESVEEVPDSD